MKHYHTLIVFLLLIAPSVVVGIHDYRQTQQSIEQDLKQALAQTLQEKQRDVITADTIRTFNNHLQLSELRGKAVLSLSTQEEELQLQADCPAFTVWQMSDQRPSMALASMALLWAAGCSLHRRKDAAAASTFGGLTYAEGRFLNSRHEEVRFTPMQQQLMEMFFRSPSHSLSKAEICAALWPKKPDASETLYTLIRRLKPIIEQHSSLEIESDRSKAYRLKIKQIGN
ncbi:MAG: helix-turn-helix domain-containing protein [Prevotella sp.]|nr:helix-turn-helix domain-containing protein [Prevotella sp.]